MNIFKRAIQALQAQTLRRRGMTEFSPADWIIGFQRALAIDDTDEHVSTMFERGQFFGVFALRLPNADLDHFRLAEALQALPEGRVVTLASYSNTATLNSDFCTQWKLHHAADALSADSKRWTQAQQHDFLTAGLSTPMTVLLAKAPMGAGGPSHEGIARARTRELLRTVGSFEHAGAPRPPMKVSEVVALFECVLTGAKFEGSGATQASTPRRAAKYAPASNGRLIRMADTPEARNLTVLTVDQWPEALESVTRFELPAPENAVVWSFTTFAVLNRVAAAQELTQLRKKATAHQGGWVPAALRRDSVGQFTRILEDYVATGGPLVRGISGVVVHTPPQHTDRALHAINSAAAHAGIRLSPETLLTQPMLVASLPWSAREAFLERGTHRSQVLPLSVAAGLTLRPRAEDWTVFPVGALVRTRTGVTTLEMGHEPGSFNYAAISRNGEPVAPVHGALVRNETALGNFVVLASDGALKALSFELGFEQVELSRDAPKAFGMAIAPGQVPEDVAETYIHWVTDLLATVDGIPLSDLEKYLVQWALHESVEVANRKGIVAVLEVLPKVLRADAIWADAYAALRQNLATRIDIVSQRYGAWFGATSDINWAGLNASGLHLHLAADLPAPLRAALCMTALFQAYRHRHFKTEAERSRETLARSCFIALEPDWLTASTATTVQRIARLGRTKRFAIGLSLDKEAASVSAQDFYAVAYQLFLTPSVDVPLGPAESWRVLPQLPANASRLPGTVLRVGLNSGISAQASTTTLELASL